MRKILVASLLLAVLPLAANAATAKKPATAAHKKPVAAAKKPVASEPQAPASQPGQPARFSMTQNGKHMTADDFDKWYKEQQAAQAVQPAATAAK